MGRNMYIKHVQDGEEDIGYHQGCLSGVIHAFDYHQWNYIRRITHKKHKGGGTTSAHGMGSLHTTLLQNQELEQLFGGNKRSLRSRIKVFSKLRKCKKQESGLSPTEQLQRTYSLHHLEPSDRRLDEIWKNKKSETVFLPGTLNNANRSLGLKQISRLEKDADICEIVDAEQESFQEIILNADDGTKMYVLPNFSIKTRFTKSGSFPTADISRKKNFSPSKLENKINETWVSSEGGSQSGNNIQKNKKHFRAKSWNFTSDTEEIPINKNLVQLFQSSKAESKDEEKNKVMNIPEESQPSINQECADKDKASTKFFPLTVLDEHPREREDENSDVRRDFIHRKSYSLSDSLERYSRLVEVTSRPDMKLQSSKSLKLRNEYDPPSTRNISFARIYSSSHLDSYYSIQRDEQGNVQIASFPLEIVPENGPFVEGDTNVEEIQNETMGMGDARSLEGESNIYMDDNEESIDNRIMIRIKEEDPHFSETTDELISQPIQNSNAETLEEKSSEQVCKAYSSINSEQRVGNNYLFDSKAYHKKFYNTNEKDSDLCYVRELLQRSSFCKEITREIWLSAEHPLMNEYILEEMEADWHKEDEREKDYSSYKHCTHHPILFDAVNQAIAYLHERASLWYPKTPSSSWHVHPMPVGRCIDEEIVATTSSFLSRKAKENESVDNIVDEDMKRDDGWMKLHSESECLAMELEDIIADELLEELLFAELIELD